MRAPACPLHVRNDDRLARKDNRIWKFSNIAGEDAALYVGTYLLSALFVNGLTCALCVCVWVA